MNALLLTLAALLLSSCSTPERRIKNNQTAFDTYPREIQDSIRAGRVDVGFTPEQTLMALGKPDRTYSRKTATVAQEVWAYGRGPSGRPGIGFGLGMSSGGSSVYGGGISVGTGDRGYYEDERVRVVFEAGKVVSVESRDK
jgi:hypothetical protein